MRSLPFALRHLALALLLAAVVGGCHDDLVHPDEIDRPVRGLGPAFAITGPLGSLTGAGGVADSYCAIGGDGLVSCWGENSGGQVSVPAGLGTALQVAAGGSSTCAIRADRTVTCWGGVNPPAPPASLGPVAQISMFGAQVCAVQVGGALACWGVGVANIPGDLGLVSSVSVGGSFTCAITTFGTVRCWGANNRGQTNVPGGLANVVHLDTGGSHACAVRGDGTVACWGSNLNAFSQTVGQSNVPPSLANVVHVSAGMWHTCAATADGSVTCWGDNAIYGQSTVPSGLGNVTSLAATGFSTCALRSDGTLTCWGRQTGLVVGGSFLDVALGGRFACAIATGGSVSCWGLFDAGQTTPPTTLAPAVQLAAGGSHACAIQSTGLVRCWGLGSSGQTTVPGALGTAAQVATGARHTCALTPAGTISCWGSNRSSNNLIVHGQATVPAGLGVATQVATGSSSDHTCALRTDATVACWGSNLSSNGTVVMGQATVPAGLGAVTQIAAGGGHTCALRDDGTVSCWGGNVGFLNPQVHYGQATVPPGLGGVIQIAAGTDHSCALTEDGRVSCWGANGQGQATVPPRLGVVVALRAGGQQSCGILTDGALECWGSPTTTSYEEPGPDVTPPGDDVAVTPIDETTGAPAAATLVFDNVLAGGETSVTSGTLNGAGAPTAPSSSDFKLGNPATYYEITTTATFAGAIQLCFDYSSASYGNESNLKLLHGVNGAWEDITDPGYPNTTTKIICGTTTSLSPFVVAETNEAPVVTSITLPSGPVPVGTTVSLTATYTDGNPTDTHTAAIHWEAASNAGNAADGTATGSFTFTAPGVYTIGVTVTDEGGLSGSRSSTLDTPAYIVVYDPSAGFVTGGGWISSPSGACTWSGCASDGSTVGKATFGFVSRYRRGATAPDGNTEFHFEAGGLRFRSTSYEWLVVAGARAQYKGTGTINGSGDYGFLLTAIDGAANGGGGTDRFRIKIWDRATGGVVYDNQRGELEDNNATTALGGGSIVIHQ
jgi:alpha-tubulin suppressor-like RCC1 family protein